MSEKEKQDEKAKAAEEAMKRASPIGWAQRYEKPPHTAPRSPGGE